MSHGFALRRVQDADGEGEGRDIKGLGAESVRVGREKVASPAACGVPSAGFPSNRVAIKRPVLSGGDDGGVLYG